MDFRRYASTLAVFATALYVALIVGAFGVLSLLLDEDPVDDPRAGLFVGPVMCAVAAAVVFGVLLVRALRRPRRRAGRPVRDRGHEVAPGTALLTGLAAWLGYAVSGGAILAVADVHAFPPFVVQQLLGPFAAAVGILAFVVVLLDTIVLSSRADEHGRPRWPWENRDEP